MQTKHLCVLIHIRIKSEVSTMKLYLRNKETQQSLQFMVNIKRNAIYCVDDIIS